MVRFFSIILLVSMPCKAFFAPPPPSPPPPSPALASPIPFAICGSIARFVGVEGAKLITAGLIYDGIKWFIKDIVLEKDDASISASYSSRSVDLSGLVKIPDSNAAVEFNEEFVARLSSNYDEPVEIRVQENCSDGVCLVMPDKKIDLVDPFPGEECCYVVFRGVALSDNLSRLVVCNDIVKEHGGGGEPKCTSAVNVLIDKGNGLSVFSEFINIPRDVSDYTHRWKRNGVVVDDIRLSVQGGDLRYRTWTTKYKGIKSGEWEVVVYLGKKIAGSIAFRVEE